MGFQNESPILFCSNTKSPRIYAGGKVIFTDSFLMPEAKAQSQLNLKRSFSELGLDADSPLLITDAVFTKPFMARLHFKA